MEALLRAIQLRKLDRVAAAYAVGGWLLVQAVSIAQPAFDLPSWSLRAFIIFICVGFPVTLAFAWFAAPHTIPNQLWALDKRRLAMLAIVGVVLLVSAFEATYWLARVTEKPAAAPASAEPPITIPYKASIAVLSFDNLSGDPAKAYFSDGISDEILNDLANVRELRVAARASSFSFKGKNTDIKTIARLLSVRTVLQGSVREAGERMRITAQLINASDGYVIWSSTFDRNLTDVLAVQDEIARAITSALTNQLLPRTVRPVTMNPEAYRLYLQGKYLFAQRTEQSELSAIPLLEKSLSLQPDFAEAMAVLGYAHITLVRLRPVDDALHLKAAKAVLGRAIRLAPDNLDVLNSHLALSLNLRDWTALIADARRMQDINPNSAVTSRALYLFYLSLNFSDLTLQFARRAAALDPLSIPAHIAIAQTLSQLMSFKHSKTAAQASIRNELIDTSQTILKLHPGHPLGLGRLCSAYAAAGRIDDARRIAATLGESSGTGFFLAICRAGIAVASGHTAEAASIVKAASASGPDSWDDANIGQYYAELGMYAKAVTYLTRAYDQGNWFLFTVTTDPDIDPDFFKQPGWIALTQRPQFKEWQAAHDMVAAQLANGPSGAQ
jgi:TolB-like protein